MVKGAVRGDVDVEVRGYRWHAPRAEGAQNALVIEAAWLDPLSPAFSEYLLEHLTRMVAARLGLLFAERILSKSAPMEPFTLSSADLTASSVISSSPVLDFVRMKCCFHANLGIALTCSWINFKLTAKKLQISLRKPIFSVISFSQLFSVRISH